MNRFRKYNLLKAFNNVRLIHKAIPDRDLGYCMPENHVFLRPIAQANPMLHLLDNSRQDHKLRKISGKAHGFNRGMKARFFWLIICIFDNSLVYSRIILRQGIAELESGRKTSKAMRGSNRVRTQESR